LSNGTPRQINILCDLALLHAYTADAMKIDPQIIRECAKRTIIPAPKPEPVAEYPKTQTIVPISQSQDMPSRESSRSWSAALTKIKSAFSLRRAAYLAPIPLIILISLIGIVFYPDNFFSSISRIQSKLKQVVSRYSEPRAEANSYQAQVVNVMPPAQSDSMPDPSAKDLENEKSRNDQLTKELAAQSALIADLQQKLEKAGAEEEKLQKHLHINRQATALLKTQVKEIYSQKASTEARLEELQTANRALTAELETMQAAKLQVAALNEKLAYNEQQLAQSIQRQKSLEADLQTANKALVNEIEQLKGSQTEVAELKNLLTEKDRLLEQKDNQREELEKELAGTIDVNKQLNTELSGQTALVAELQKNLGTAKEAQTVLEGQLQESRDETESLRTQLKENNLRTVSAENELAKLQTARVEPGADSEKLKNAQAEVLKLQNLLDAKDRMMSERDQQLQDMKSVLDKTKSNNVDLQSELSAQTAKVADLQNKLGDIKKTDVQVAELKHAMTVRDKIIAQKERQQERLESNLVQEQNTKDKLISELSTQTALVDDLQKELETVRADQAAGVVQLQQNRQKMARLQEQLNELNAQKSPSATNPPGDPLQESSPASLDNREAEPEAPDAADIIDWVIKKKSE
jgi:chromosome segregation ATPase